MRRAYRVLGLLGVAAASLHCRGALHPSLGQSEPEVDCEAAREAILAFEEKGCGDPTHRLLLVLSGRLKSCDCLKQTVTYSQESLPCGARGYELSFALESGELKFSITSGDIGRCEKYSTYSPCSDEGSLRRTEKGWEAEFRKRRVIRLHDVPDADVPDAGDAAP